MPLPMFNGTKSIFDYSRAYGHAEYLSTPRAVGCDGEKKARAYCLAVLENAGVRAHCLAVTFSTLPDTMTRVLPFVFGAIVGILSLMRVTPPWIGTLILACAAVAGAVAASPRVFLKRLHAARGNRESANVIGHIPALSGEKRHLVFMAHYDSKSQVLPIAVRSVCFIGLLACYAAAIASLPLLYLWDGFDYRTNMLLCGYVSLLFGTVLLFNRTQNRSPGAADNACGVAIVLELARVFSHKPLKHVRVSFLLTGAEEYGMAGAFGYMREKPDLGRDVCFVNIDGVGGAAPLRLIGRSGATSASAKGSSLAQGLAAAAREASLPLVRTWPLLGIGFDHVVMASGGFDAVTLSSGGLPMLLRIHSPRDTIDAIAPPALEGIGMVCERYARELDRS